MVELDLNEIITAIANQRGITTAEALEEFKKNYIHKSQVNDIRGATQPRVVDMINSKDDMSLAISEQSKIEMRRLEMEDRRLKAEERKAELAERKLELEEKDRREQHAIDRERQREDALLNRWMIMGKKPDDGNKLLESQAELYKAMLSSKDAERDREIEWKKSLAEIEKERDVELEKLRREDPKAANSTEVLVDFLGQKFETLGQQLAKNPTNDFLAQIEAHNKFQEGLVKAALPIFKAQGLSDEQLQKIKNQVGLEEIRQDDTLDKIWGVGKTIWKNYIEPAATKAQKQQEQMGHIPSGLEGGITSAEQQRIAQQEEARIRKETEARASQITAQLTQENEALEQEKKRITEIIERRQALVAHAQGMGLQFDPALPDDQLYDLILQAQQQQRDTLVANAAELGIVVNESMTDEQIFDLIEREKSLRVHEETRKHEMMEEPAKEPVLETGSVVMPESKELEKSAISKLRETITSPATSARSSTLSDAIETGKASEPEIIQKTPKKYSRKERVHRKTSKSAETESDDWSFRGGY